MLSPHKINVNIMYNLVRPTFLHFEDFDLFKTIDLIDILMTNVCNHKHNYFTLLKETRRKMHGLYYGFRDIFVCWIFYC